MVIVPGTLTKIPGRQVARRPTRAANAWLGGYITVQLDGELAGMRVHVGATDTATVNPLLASGAGLRGRWLAIGDFIQTYGEYLRTRALPAHFTQAALCTCLPGTILNVGRCGPLFERA